MSLERHMTSKKTRWSAMGMLRSQCTTLQMVLCLKVVDRLRQAHVANQMSLSLVRASVDRRASRLVVVRQEPVQPNEKLLERPSLKMMRAICTRAARLIQGSSFEQMRLTH